MKNDLLNAAIRRRAKEDELLRQEDEIYGTALVCAECFRALGHRDPVLPLCEVCRISKYGSNHSAYDHVAIEWQRALSVRRRMLERLAIEADRLLSKE